MTDLLTQKKTDNLRPYRFKKGDTKLQIAGGSVSSPRKKFAAKLRELKKRGKLRTEDEEWLYQRLTDSTINYADIISSIDFLETTAKTFNEKRQLIKLKLEFSKRLFGDRTFVKIEGVGERVQDVVELLLNSNLQKGKDKNE